MKRNEQGQKDKGRGGGPRIIGIDTLFTEC